MNAPIDAATIRIETERLILRPWRMEDAEDFYEYCRGDGVGQMAGWAPHRSIEESKSVLSLFIEKNKTLALELKENRKVIGSLGFEKIKDVPEIPDELMGRELGYVLSKDYWGRGLMPEAVKAVIDYCFRVLNFDYLTCAHFTRNLQSRRVIEKSGFLFYKDVNAETQFGSVEDTKLYIQYNPNKGGNYV